VARLNWGGRGDLRITFNLIGLLMNLSGVILLFVFGMPFRVPVRIVEQCDRKAIRTECWYDVLGLLGLP
jgi:hypothetical protein